MKLPRTLREKNPSFHLLKCGLADHPISHQVQGSIDAREGTQLSPNLDDEKLEDT